MSDFVQPFFLDDRIVAEPKTVRQRHPSKSSKSKKATQVFDCSTCKLDEQCRSPKMLPYGEGKKEILIVALCPGTDEDALGRPLVGKSGQFAQYAFDSAGIDMNEDCVRTNIVICRPPRKKDGSIRSPTNHEIRCCRSNLLKTIKEVKPKLIYCMGKEAINSVLNPSTFSPFIATQMHGRVIPSLEWGCWIACTFHPAFIIRGGRYKKEDGKALKLIFLYDVAKALLYLDKPLPKGITPELGRKYGNYLLNDSEKVISFLQSIDDSDVVSFDYEATTISPFVKGARILTVSISVDDEGFCIPLGRNDWSEVEQAYVESAFIKFLKSEVGKIVQNNNCEALWSKVYYDVWPENVIHDTMVAAHVINCTRNTTGLGFQVYESTGVEYKGMVDYDNLAEVPLERLAVYNNLDSRYEYHSYERQLKLLRKTGTEEFYRFLHGCLPTLARMSYRGVKIDLRQLEKFDEETRYDIEDAVADMGELDCVVDLEKRNHVEFNPNSDDHIATILFDVCGCEEVKETKGGGLSTDKEVLEQLLISQYTSKKARLFIKKLQEYKSLHSFVKLIKNYRKLADDQGFVHPVFSLNIAESYRSSCSDPNLQNVPQRHEFLARFRKCIIPTEGRVLYEVDQKGHEVRVIAMASGDRALIKEIENGIDTHTKWAAEIYEKDMRDVTVLERFLTKNQFVFASFYGATPESIAWSFGIDVEHIRRVQNHFWNTYKGVKAWLEGVISFYERHGYIVAMSGFKRYGPLSIRQIANTPIQGPAFHLLLDGLRRTDEEQIRRLLDTYPIFQVHDSIVLNVVPEEAEENVSLVSKILKSKRFDWQRNVPLEVEWSRGPNWFDMEEFDYKRIAA